MKIKAELKNDLRAMMGEEYLDLEGAVTRGVAASARGLQRDLRAQVAAAGLGKRLASAWRLAIYPATQVSAKTAGVVWTKAPMLIKAFDEGATIRSAAGFFLAIPSDAAPAKGVGGGKINPSNFPEGVYGPLRFVYRRNGPSMLVVDSQVARKRGGFRRSKNKRALKTQRGLLTVPMFFLFPQVKIRKRLDVATAANTRLAALPAVIDREFARGPRRD